MQVKTKAKKNIKYTNNLHFDYMAVLICIFIQFEVSKIMP